MMTALKYPKMLHEIKCSTKYECLRGDEPATPLMLIYATRLN